MDISSFKNYLAEHNDNTDRQVSSMLVSSLFGSSMIISGDFSARRIFEFAGQQIGESYFRNTPSESKDQLVAEIADFFKKIGLGEVVHENMQPGGKQFVTSIIVLRDGVLSYFVKIGKPCCFLEKEIIRNAFVSFTRRLNISVEETECYCSSADHCRFEVSMLPA